MSEAVPALPEPECQFSRQDARCPAPADRSAGPDASGVWHIRDFGSARAVLRAEGACQAGFRADAVRAAMAALRITVSVLYQDGEPHLRQRRRTARSFTPATVTDSYAAMMDDVAGRVSGRLRRAGQADISALSLEMAVEVAAHIVGLTDSHRPANLHTRLARFFSLEIVPFGWRPGRLLAFVRMIPAVLALHLLDVRPAIRARARARRTDVISNLLDQGCSPIDILSECITYATAGMVTTREFMGMALWHVLERPELRARYLAAPRAERLAILREILRVEPVISHLHRRTVADVPLGPGGQVIPRGALVDIHLHEINLDERTAGRSPLEIHPARQLAGDRVPAEVISFGDGRHRCPGEYVAIQETDALLRHLLPLPGLRLVRPPDLGHNDLVSTYELRNFLVAVG